MNFEKLELNVLSTSDHKKLAEVSPYAQENIDELGVVIEDGFAVDSFHPNGECGSIELHGSYFGDITCDHLIWMDGSNEAINCKSTLLFANHKGNVRKLVIHWLEGIESLSFLTNNQ